MCTTPSYLVNVTFMSIWANKIKRVQNDFETINPTENNHKLQSFTITENTPIEYECSGYWFSIIWLSDNYHRSVDYLHNRYRLSSVFGALTSRVTLLWFTQHGCTCHSQSVTLQMSQRAITEVLTMSTTGIDWLVSKPYKPGYAPVVYATWLPIVFTDYVTTLALGKLVP